MLWKCRDERLLWCRIVEPRSDQFRTLGCCTSRLLQLILRDGWEVDRCFGFPFSLRRVRAVIFRYLRVALIPREEFVGTTQIASVGCHGFGRSVQCTSALDVSFRRIASRRFESWTRSGIAFLASVHGDSGLVIGRREVVVADEVSEHQSGLDRLPNVHAAGG